MSLWKPPSCMHATREFWNCFFVFIRRQLWIVMKKDSWNRLDVGPVWFCTWFPTFFQNRIKRVSYHFKTMLKCVFHVCQPYAIKISILKILAISGFCKWTTYSFYNLFYSPQHTPSWSIQWLAWVTLLVEKNVIWFLVKIFVQNDLE